MKRPSTPYLLCSVYSSLLAVVAFSGCQQSPTHRAAADSAVEGIPLDDAGIPLDATAAPFDSAQAPNVDDLEVCAASMPEASPPGHFLFRPDNTPALVTVDAGIGDPSQEKVSADPDFSGCAPTAGDAPLQHCRGLATVITNDSQLRLRLQDGSEFDWLGEGPGPRTISNLSAVHLNYEEHWETACFFCARYRTQHLTITQHVADGQLLHYQEFSEAKPEQVLPDLLGTPVREQVLCQEATTEPRGCYLDVATVRAEYRVQTETDQVLPFAQATDLQTTQGDFSVWVAHSFQTGVHDDKCADGEALRAATTITISRR